VLGRSPARRRRERLHRARQVEQVRTLGVVEPQRSGERVEHAVRDAGHVAALKPGVVREPNRTRRWPSSPRGRRPVVLYELAGNRGAAISRRQS
jgi:hypothetical protein